MKEKLGYYAGSFNPFHIGHLDVVKQAKRVFDIVMVSKLRNPEKENEKIINAYPLPITFLADTVGVRVGNFDGLLVNSIKAWEEVYDVTLVRGLRNGADLDYEQNFSAFLKDMYPQIKIVAFYCDPKLRHISSTTLRGIQRVSDEEYKKYVITAN